MDGGCKMLGLADQGECLVIQRPCGFLGNHRFHRCYTHCASMPVSDPVKKFDKDRKYKDCLQFLPISVPVPMPVH